MSAAVPPILNAGNYSLPRTLWALMRAKRILGDQQGRTTVGPAFNDYLP